MPPLANSTERFQAAKVISFSDRSGAAASWVGLLGSAAVRSRFFPGGVGRLRLDAFMMAAITVASR